MNHRALHLNHAPTEWQAPSLGRDSPEAGAPEMKLTDKMIAAGAHLIAEEWGVVGADVATDLARDVFRIMWAARPR
jgi:hypothetical protein